MEKENPEDLLLEHYLAATGESSNPGVLVRRIIEWIKRFTKSKEEILADENELFNSIPIWLSQASAHGKNKIKIVISIDALNSLQSYRDLRWFPNFIPENVFFIVSTFKSDVEDALLKKNKWEEVEVIPLTYTNRRSLFVKILSNYNKKLPEKLTKKS